MFFRLNNKDLIKRKNFNRNELKRCQLKQLKCVGVLKKIKKVMFKVQIVNRCLLTGKQRSVYSSFRLSRMKVRELCSFGFFYGIHKASW